MSAGACVGVAAVGVVGLGVQPPTREGGAVRRDARVRMRSTPRQRTGPGLAVVSGVLAINLAGDALRDALAKEGSHE